MAVNKSCKCACPCYFCISELADVRSSSSPFSWTCELLSASARFWDEASITQTCQGSFVVVIRTRTWIVKMLNCASSDCPQIWIGFASQQKSLLALAPCSAWEQGMTLLDLHKASAWWGFEPLPLSTALNLGLLRLSEYIVKLSTDILKVSHFSSEKRDRGFPWLPKFKVPLPLESWQGHLWTQTPGTKFDLCVVWLWNHRICTALNNACPEESRKNNWGFGEHRIQG